jgi:adenylate kinase
MLAADNKKLTRAIHFQIPDESLVNRILGRLVHPASGRTYHTEFHPPKVEGIDDVSKTKKGVLFTHLLCR